MCQKFELLQARVAELEERYEEIQRRLFNIKMVEDGWVKFPTEQVLIEQLIKHGQMRTYAKILGGAYKQYGVRIWPETFEEVGLSISQFQIGLNPFNGWVAVASVERESVKKVIGLRRIS